MAIERRTFLALGGLGLAGLTLTACNPASAPVLSVSAQGNAGMNPGPDGSDRPVTLNVVQMSGTGAFNAADVFALQDPAAALGGEFVKSDRLVLAPGGSASLAIPLQPTTTAIGVTGGFISPGGKTVRSTIPAPGADSGLIISVGSGGISLSTA